MTPPPVHRGEVRDEADRAALQRELDYYMETKGGEKNMAKVKKAKKAVVKAAKPQDATMRNVRAGKKRDVKLSVQMRQLATAVSRLGKKVLSGQKKAAKAKSAKLPAWALKLQRQVAALRKKV